MSYSRLAMRQELDDLVRGARHVTIVPEKLRDVALAMRQTLTTPSADFQTDPHQYPDESMPENNLDSLQFYLVLTAQEFCIWRRSTHGGVEAWDITIDGRQYVGARGIAAAHVRAMRQGKPILDPAYLAAMTLTDVEDFYRDERDGKVTLQMLPQRLAKFNELGRVLADQYGGHAAQVLRRAGGYLFRNESDGFIQQLLLHFPIAYFDWPFCKLGFLCAKFLTMRRREGIPTSADYLALTEFRDPENLEIAADYYIPLFFMRVGIFRISEELSRRLREQQLIERDSRFEREIRACTIAAGRALAEKASSPIPTVDTECWKTGYLRCRLCKLGMTDEELPCPYRERSKGFQEEPALMEMCWPLVFTTCY